MNKKVRARTGTYMCRQLHQRLPCHRDETTWCRQLWGRFILAPGFSPSQKGRHGVGTRTIITVRVCSKLLPSQRTTEPRYVPTAVAVAFKSLFQWSASLRLHRLSERHHQLGNKHSKQEPVGGVPASRYGALTILSSRHEGDHLDVMEGGGWFQELLKTEQ